MGIWDFINSSTEAVKRNAPDPVKNLCRTSYNYGSAACRTSYSYGSAAYTKIDNIVRVNGLQKLNQWLPDDEAKSKMGIVASRLAKSAAIYALNGHHSVGHVFVPDMDSCHTDSCSLFIPICYFGEFEMDENWRWSWKWTSDEPCMSTISIRSNTSFTDLYGRLLEKLNIDPSQYDMNLGFLCTNSSISLPPLRVTCLEEIMWLIELNKKSETTPLCVTLVRNDNSDSEHEEFDGGDQNKNSNSGGVEASNIASKTIKKVERETLKEKPKPLGATDSAPGRQFTGTRKLMDGAEMQPGSHYHVD